jgi:hypothetical protein
MEFKIRANIVMSKELSIEADNLSDAMDKAQEIMAGPQNMKEFKPSKVQFEVLNYTVG